MPSPAPARIASAPQQPARQVILRLWRSYIRAHAGLLLFAVAAMVLSSAMISAVPFLVNWAFKLFSLRRDAALLVPLALAGFVVMITTSRRTVDYSNVH